MDLSDAALREQAQVECIRCEGSGCGVCRDQGKRYIALRDATRAEQREADAKIAEAQQYVFGALDLISATARAIAAAIRSQR